MCFFVPVLLAILTESKEAFDGMFYARRRMAKKTNFIVEGGHH